MIQRTTPRSRCLAIATLMALAVSAAASAQSPPTAAPASAATSAAPAADVSAGPAASSAAAGASAQGAAAAPAPAKRATTRKPAVDPASVEPKVKSDARAGKTSRALDRLELDTTQITGNRELPKVMVVVPWKKSDIGDLVGRPVNSLVDEALEPVDREVFRREVDYYGALAPDRPAGSAATRSETGVTPAADAPRAEK